MMSQLGRKIKSNKYKIGLGGLALSAGIYFYHRYKQISRDSLGEFIASAFPSLNLFDEPIRDVKTVCKEADFYTMRRFKMTKNDLQSKFAVDGILQKIRSKISQESEAEVIGLLNDLKIAVYAAILYAAYHFVLLVFLGRFVFNKRNQIMFLQKNPQKFKFDPIIKSVDENPNFFSRLSLGSKKFFSDVSADTSTRAGVTDSTNLDALQPLTREDSLAFDTCRNLNNFLELAYNMQYSELLATATIKAVSHVLASAEPTQKMTYAELQSLLINSINSINDSLPNTERGNQRHQCVPSNDSSGNKITVSNKAILLLSDIFLKENSKATENTPLENENNLNDVASLVCGFFENTLILNQISSVLHEITLFMIESVFLKLGYLTSNDQRNAANLSQNTANSLPGINYSAMQNKISPGVEYTSLFDSLPIASKFTEEIDNRIFYFSKSFGVFAYISELVYSDDHDSNFIINAVRQELLEENFSFL